MTDFGLAERFKHKDQFKSKKFVGKKQYKSPEVMLKYEFNAKSNDLWCVGVCLFMILCGIPPWEFAMKSDRRFKEIVLNNNLINVLKSWNKIKYVNNDIVDLFDRMFQFEHKRIGIQDLKKHSWLKY